MKNFDYDEMTDSLFISRKKEGEKVQGSAEIGNITLDFTSEGRIVGAELSGISKLMKMMNFSPNLLIDLTEARLEVQKQKNAVSIFAFLKTPSLQQPIPLATIPLLTNIMS